MERVVVVFDVLEPTTGNNLRIARLWNEPNLASDYIHTYIDSREDLTWAYNNDESLQELSPGAVIEFYGYSNEDKTKCDDMITVFHVEALDPDNDPLKRIVRNIIADYDETDKNDIPDDEKGHLEYAVDMFRDLVLKIDEIEQKNLNKGKENVQ